ncbi:hypothetical protein HL658_32090 [Azospirillum sp. RWY-5-1]|uniref:Uncharacterized protein n=1 Tax=Azospirillum oleiclasticum TaxID=2735135 RepID=A0ABX2TFH3_9PROT|nr:hypothetical protein [Azospirillum oleiclasticum]NYZ17210.1 hypothetical protein [Azospirillum oleiclasticum]NYZ23081.1 hypothetical protein [Azospirillum oleiclasticum]
MSGAGDVEAIDLGYVVARAMRFYGWTYWEALDTPVQAFWMLHRNIDRLSAEEDLRALENTAVATRASPDMVEAYEAERRNRLGTVAIERPVFDRDGLNALRSMTRTV